MIKDLENTKEHYEVLLNDIKEKATKIYEKIAENKETTLDEDKKFVKKSLDKIELLLEEADCHNEDFLLELQSYLKRIDSMLKHLEVTKDEKKKSGILHRYKYTLLKSLLDLEYEIGSI